MIYLRLAGGLGNQLFQLAAAITISNKTNIPIRIYSKSLNKYEVSRDFKLSFLGYTDSININTIHKIILRYRLVKFLSFFSNSFISDTNFNLKKLKKTIYLDGYFHNLNEIELGMKILKKSFFKIEIDNILKKINLNIDFENDLAVHVRRGDYLTKKNKKIYKKLGYKYYSSSLKKIKYNNIYIFCTEKIDFNLDLNQKEMYLYNLNDIEDFMLMSKFKKLIISNSTFAFCSAFFSNFNEKEIIAPKNYYLKQKENKLWINNFRQSKFKINNKT
jgi:hypothetical protein